MCAAVWRLVEPPLLLWELIVGEVIHQPDHLNIRKLLGAHPAWVPVPAHAADYVGPGLEGKHSARHEGSQQIRGLEALRLHHHLKPGESVGGGR